MNYRNFRHNKKSDTQGQEMRSVKKLKALLKTHVAINKLLLNIKQFQKERRKKYKN